MMAPEEANAILAQYVADHNEIRVYLRRPISYGDWVYATNGALAIRVPKAEGIDADVSRDLNTLELHFARRRNDTAIDLPPILEPVPCIDCDGTGLQYECQDCDGDGEIQYRNHEYECKECCGSGVVTDPPLKNAKALLCQACKGTKENIFDLTVIGNRQFRTHYLRKISALPGFVFTDSKEDAAFFKFDGGEGLLMKVNT